MTSTSSFSGEAETEIRWLLEDCFFAVAAAVRLSGIGCFSAGRGGRAGGLETLFLRGSGGRTAP